MSDTHSMSRRDEVARVLGAAGGGVLHRAAVPDAGAMRRVRPGETSGVSGSQRLRPWATSAFRLSPYGSRTICTSAAASTAALCVLSAAENSRQRWWRVWVAVAKAMGRLASDAGTEAIAISDDHRRPEAATRLWSCLPARGERRRKPCPQPCPERSKTDSSLPALTSPNALQNGEVPAQRHISQAEGPGFETRRPLSAEGPVCGPLWWASGERALRTE
jgi:hypothetical protein